MEHKAYFKNKTGSNAVTTHSDTKRNIPGDSLSPLFICIELIPLTNELNRAECGYQVHGTERKISHLLYMDDLKLQGRNENELKNKMKIVQTINKDMNMNFGLEKCTRICLKIGSVQSKMHVGTHLTTTLKNWTREKQISV